MTDFSTGQLAAQAEFAAQMDGFDEGTDGLMYETDDTTGIVNLLHYDYWYEVPEGWFEAFRRGIDSLAEHEHAFLFSGVVAYNADLGPLSRTALVLFNKVIGSVVMDPHAFRQRTFEQFSSIGETFFSYFVPENIVGDASNWLGDLVTHPENGRSTPDRVPAAEALLDALNVFPPIEPLNERIEACRTVVQALLKIEHRELLVDGGFRDVYDLVERLAEQTNPQVLSDLCRPAVRMLQPVTILDEISAREDTSVLPPSALRIAAASLQGRAERAGAQLEEPAELLEALGASRSARLDAEVDLEALRDQAAAWIEEIAVREDHFLARRWLSAAWELDVRVQLRDPGDSVWTTFEYEELYARYIDTSQASYVAAETIDENDEANDVSFEIVSTGEKASEAAIAAPWSMGDAVDSILAELDAIVGQPELKQQIRQLVAQVKINRKREEHGRKGGQPAIHMVFSGPPGTGKTTVARLIGKLYHALGVLPSSAFKEVDRADLVAAIIGGTEANTAKAISEAMGGVLFVDEAYALVDGSENDFGQQAVNTLLKALTDHRGEFVCIVAGYPDKMKKFLDSNPGMKSRFDRTITFAPYGADELVEIAVGMARSDDNHLDEGAIDALRLRLADKEQRGGFTDETWGNARDVGTIVRSAAAHRDLRISEAGLHDIDSIVRITEADMLEACKGMFRAPTGAQEETKDVLAELNRQVGQEQLKRQVRVLLANARAAQARAAVEGPAALPTIPHMIFTGPPGTGKTTIARLIARLYKTLGILPSGHVIEVDKGGLVAGYIGQTAQKTTEKIDDAMNGVLFIDEAYALANGGEHDFGKEAIETLLKRMEDDRGRFLVIAAGYPDQMDSFLQSNVGLSRRFPIKIEFTPYSADELSRIAELMFENEGQQLANEARTLIRARLDAAETNGLFMQKDWGNGGSVRNIVEETISVKNLRLFDEPNATPNADELVTVIADDIDSACDKFLGAALPIEA